MTAILRIKSDVDLALDQSTGVVLVLLDLSAAFDTIDHTILWDLERLQSHGITGAASEWVGDYLSGCTLLNCSN